MDPQFRHLTQSNIPATRAEASDIRELIFLEETSAFDIEDQINSILSYQTRPDYQHQILSALYSQRYQHYKHIRRYKSILSVVRRLPIEILAEIFLFCCIGPAFLPPSRTDPRLMLSHTSSRWRAIALGLPEMWNSVALLLSSRASVRYDEDWIRQSKMDSEMTVGIAKEWLGRAGSVQPLEIIWEYSVSIFGSEMLIRDILVPNSRRLRSMELHVPHDTFEFFMNSLRGPFPLLESLRVFLTPQLIGPNLWKQNSISIFTRSAPRLQHLVFDMPSFDSDSSLIRFPLSELTTLRLRCPDISTCHNIFDECPKLVECELVLVHHTIDDPMSSDDENTYITTMRHLRILRFLQVGATSRLMIDSFLQDLTLPALEDLSMPLPQSPDTFLEFASRSGITLSRLSLKLYTSPVSKENTLEAILQRMPYLPSLKLFGLSDYDLVFDMMSRSKLVPELQVLEVVFESDGSIVVDGLIATIESRKPRRVGTSKPCLRKATISLPSPHNYSLPTDAWRRDGLDVEVIETQPID